MSRTFRIHPAIGVARVGNSPDGFFVGPETPGVPGNWDDERGEFKSFRDSGGRVLRQGARFRVFEYFADGRPPREVSVGDGAVDIEWRVHLANRKASFFVFNGQDGAEDLYARRSGVPADQQIKDDPPRTNLRNATVPPDQREERLDIDPGEQLISTRGTPGPVELTNRKSQIPIRSLGTLRLDENGRLIVLGGFGQSASTETPERQITEYASNDTWFDDTGDGPVKARVRLDDGSFVDADPAWVMVGPPDFAPGIGNAVTLFDTLCDLAVRDLELPPAQDGTALLARLFAQQAVWKSSGGKTLRGYRPSFTKEIYPLLKRALGARDTHDPGAADAQFHVRAFADPGFLTSLNDANGAEMRRHVFRRMRDPDGTEADWKNMPRGLGDDYTPLGNDLAPTPRSFLSVTRIQYAMLREWAEGSFIDDWPGKDEVPRSLKSPSPDDLDQAAAENCVGGPFFPGIEVSWLIRVPGLYAAPFRIKSDRTPAGEGSAQVVRIGSLTLRSGFFSQQMALPWQADFYDCHKERKEDPDGAEIYFMWWTAHRPDDVYPSGRDQKERWVRAFDDGLPPEEADDLERMDRFTQMQRRWQELKFVSVLRNGTFEEEP